MTGENKIAPVYSFTENKGQLINSENLPASDVLFYCSVGGMNIYICKNKLYYVLSKKSEGEVSLFSDNEGADRNFKKEFNRVEVSLANCNSNISANAEEESSLVSNYYLQNCPNGITAKSYKKIRLENVYPGINWVLYFKEENGNTVFKYDFEVNAGADVNRIRLKYSGATKITKSIDGGIDIETLFGKITDGKPFSYLKDSKQEIKSSFKFFNDQIGFDLNNYDKKEKIIIDPTVLWSTYYGYNGDEHGRAVAVDANGFIYAGGFTNSTNFPVLNGYSSPVHQGFDGWIMKLTPSFQPIWVTYYGGSLADVCRTLEVDSAGNVFAGLETRSADMPTFNAYQQVKGDTDDLFIMKLNPSGIPIWASFYGGNNLDAMRRIKLSNFGYLLASGYSKSTNFPMINPIQGTNAGDADAVIMKISMATGFPIWSTYYGGSGYDEPVGITTDNNNNIFVVGTTLSTNFPVLNAFQGTKRGPSDIFVLKLNANLSVAWSTYIGSTMDDDGNGIGVDNNGNCFILGTTKKGNYPILNAWDNDYNGPSDAVVTKFSPTGSMIWSTYAGGQGTEDGNSIAVDNSGNVLATGYTLSTSFPMVNAIQPVFGGIHDAFILRFSNTGTCLMSTYYGGNGMEHARSIAVDNSGNAYIVGSTESTNLLLVNPIQSANGSLGNASADCFMLKLNYSLHVKPFIFLNGNNPKCNFSDTVLLTSNNSLGNIWSNGATTQSINVNQPGGYFVTSYDSTGIGVKSDNLIIQNSLLADYISDSTGFNNLCRYSSFNLNTPIINSASFIWINPNGNALPLLSTSIDNLQDSSLGIYSCIAIIGNCSKVVRKINLINFFDQVIPTGISFSGPVCPGGSFTISIDSIAGVQILWIGPNGFTANSKTISVLNAQPQNSGIYAVKWIMNGCESSVSNISAIVHSNPVANAGGDVNLCSGQNVQLLGTGGVSYTWFPSAGLSATNISNPIASPTISTTYILSVIDLNNCQNTDDVVFTISSLPVPDAGQDLIACNGNNSINLEGIAPSSGIGTWTCTTPPKATIQNTNNPSTLVTNLKVGSNQFKWTVSNGACTPAYDLTIVKYTTAANFGCIKPSNLKQTINGNAATLNWSNCTIADQFQFRYTINNVSYNVLTTNFTTVLNNLAPGIYTWKVRPKCNGVWSAFSISKTFVIYPLHEEENITQESDGLFLFPNPVSGQLNISFNVHSAGNYKIEMIDVLGKVLNSQTAEFEEGKWSLNFYTGELGGGIYFIRLTGIDNTYLINKFIKQ